MKKTTTIILSLLISLLTLSLPASAYSYTLANCPNSGGYTITSLQKKSHEGFPGSNYHMSIDVKGYYWIIYEDWDCDYCGYHVSKQTIQTGGILNENRNK